jgi:DNA-directed RNA polymerase specialized sigma24 family protein
MKFQWLKDYQELDGEIAYIEWNIRKSKLELIRWEDGDLTKVFLERDSKGSQVESKIEELKELLTEKIELKKILMILIDTFKGIESQILIKKYVEGKTLEVIAEEPNYSYGHIKSKHAELRRRLDFIGDYDAVRF